MSIYTNEKVPRELCVCVCRPYTNKQTQVVGRTLDLVLSRASEETCELEDLFLVVQPR